jgi:hypothetical protein
LFVEKSLELVGGEGKQAFPRGFERRFGADPFPEVWNATEVFVNVPFGDGFFDFLREFGVGEVACELGSGGAVEEAAMAGIGQVGFGGIKKRMDWVMVFPVACEFFGAGEGVVVGVGHFRVLVGGWRGV